jgi:mRNA interferase MazF
MIKGDIVLIPFPFTDLSGNKNRPAVILIDSEEDVTVCFITAQLKWQTEFDIILKPSDLNGLKKLSLVRLTKFATIDKDLIIGRLGSFDDNNIDLLNSNLIKILKLDNLK